MAVRAKKTTKGTVYWVFFRWQGKRVYERSGTDRRDAERLERQRRNEVRLGTYVPRAQSIATTVGQFARAWLDKRTNRSASDDRRWLEKHVLPREWFASMPIVDVRPRHIGQLVEELKVSVSEQTAKPLAGKSISNAYGTLRTMFRDARIAELTGVDPCALPKGAISRKTTVKRSPYATGDARALLSHPAIPPDAVIFNAIAFFTGCREGEICGLRWRAWDENPEPLGMLDVSVQYDDQPLKTDDARADHPRVVPVHPELAEMLAAWRADGFELVYCRKPTIDDLIVPHRKTMAAHSRSSAYKMWRRSCDAAGVENRSLHSTRHTFISLARRGGARKDVIEQITHNAKGDIVDAYTTWDWEPLCEAVLCVKLEKGARMGATIVKLPIKQVEAPGIEVGARSASKQKSAPIGEFGGLALGQVSADIPCAEARGAAGAHPALAKAATSLAVQKATWDAFDLMWAESLGVEIGGAR